MKATVPLQAEGEGELPALEIQAEVSCIGLLPLWFITAKQLVWLLWFQAEIEPASVSTQVIAEVSVAEGSLFTLDSSVVPDSSVGMEIVVRGKILRDMKLFNLIYFS